MSLPANWTRYTTDEGKEYFHNAVTNVTQWHPPVEAAAAAPVGGSSSTGADAHDVFTYNPTDTELESPAVTGNFSSSPAPQAFGGGSSGMTDSELVSLTAAPSGKISSSPPSGSGGGASSGGSGGGFFGGLAPGGGGAEGGEGGNQVAGAFGWALNSAQKYFDVSTDDVVSRLKLVLVPYKATSLEAKEELKSRPDLYGPFWVATTAILFLAATGNFARLVEAGDHTAFKADYSLVSLAAGTIYGCLLGVPLLARGSVFLSGEEVSAVNFTQLICICGYSLAPAIPASLLCLIPVGALRWIIVLAGLALSLLFVKAHLLTEITATTPWLKYTLMIAPCVMPVVVFVMYRVHFFSSSG